MLRDTTWDEAVRAVRGDAHGLVSTHAELVERWSEPHRGYHDLVHLNEVVTALTELRDHVVTDTEWAAVAFAAWFHDAVYDVVAVDGNERRSADLARIHLTAHAVPQDVVDLVVDLVLASRTHEVTSTTGPRAAFHDADLWILAAPERRFDDYCAAIRREYAAVPDDAYAEGRMAVLAPFLSRPWIYRTDHARTRWESAARHNLRREEQRLVASAPDRQA